MTIKGDFMWAATMRLGTAALGAGLGLGVVDFATSGIDPLFSLGITLLSTAAVAAGIWKGNYNGQTPLIPWLSAGAGAGGISGVTFLSSLII